MDDEERKAYFIPGLGTYFSSFTQLSNYVE